MTRPRRPRPHPNADFRSVRPRRYSLSPTSSRDVLVVVSDLARTPSPRQQNNVEFLTLPETSGGSSLPSLQFSRGRRASQPDSPTQAIMSVAQAALQGGVIGALNPLPLTGSEGFNRAASAWIGAVGHSVSHTLGLTNSEDVSVMNTSGFVEDLMDLDQPSGSRSRGIRRPRSESQAPRTPRSTSRRRYQWRNVSTSQAVRNIRALMSMRNRRVRYTDDRNRKKHKRRQKWSLEDIRTWRLRRRLRSTRRVLRK